MNIIKAENKDSIILTELTIRSKNYWNYGKEQIELWRSELTIKDDYIKKNAVFKGIIDQQIIGYYAYKLETQSVAKLTHLFVDPVFIGKGYGKLLLLDSLERIGNAAAKRVVVDADPNAEDFYRHHGFTVTGKLQSSIEERFLPIMEFKVHNKINS